MPETRTNTYEALFLFPQAAVADLQHAVDHARDLISRGEGEVISLIKWDERRLAYEIRGNKRGLYLLSYFRCPADRVHEIERVCNLSEQILRALITRCDHLTVEQMEQAQAQQALADEIRLRGDEETDTDEHEHETAGVGAED